jgi:hypothetical protein
VAVYEPVVKHTLTVEQVERWLDGATSSPHEKVKKDRLKGMMAGYLGSNMKKSKES